MSLRRGGLTMFWECQSIAPKGHDEAFVHQLIMCLAKTRFSCIFNNFARHSSTHYFPDQNSHLA